MLKPTRRQVLQAACDEINKIRRKQYNELQLKYQTLREAVNARVRNDIREYLKSAVPDFVAALDTLGLEWNPTTCDMYVDGPRGKNTQRKTVLQLTVQFPDDAAEMLKMFNMNAAEIEGSRSTYDRMQGLQADVTPNDLAEQVMEDDEALREQIKSLAVTISDKMNAKHEAALTIERRKEYEMRQKLLKSEI